MIAARRLVRSRTSEARIRIRLGKSASSKEIRSCPRRPTGRRQRAVRCDRDGRYTPGSWRRIALRARCREVDGPAKRPRPSQIGWLGPGLWLAEGIHGQVWWVRRLTDSASPGCREPGRTGWDSPAEVIEGASHESRFKKAHPGRLIDRTTDQTVLNEQGSYLGTA